MLATPARGIGATMLGPEPSFHARLCCRSLPKSTTTGLYLTRLPPPALSEKITSPSLTSLLTPAKGAGTLVDPAQGSGATTLVPEPPFVPDYQNLSLPLFTQLRCCPLTYPKPPPPHS